MRKALRGLLLATLPDKPRLAHWPANNTTASSSPYCYFLNPSFLWQCSNFFRKSCWKSSTPPLFSLSFTYIWHIHSSGNLWKSYIPYGLYVLLAPFGWNLQETRPNRSIGACRAKSWEALLSDGAPLSFSRPSRTCRMPWARGFLEWLIIWNNNMD